MLCIDINHSINRHKYRIIQQIIKTDQPDYQEKRPSGEDAYSSDCGEYPNIISNGYISCRRPGEALQNFCKIPGHAAQRRAPPFVISTLVSMMGFRNKEHSKGIRSSHKTVSLILSRPFINTWLIAILTSLSFISTTTPLIAAPSKYYSISDGEWGDNIWSSVSNAGNNCNCVPTCNFTRDVVITHQVTVSTCSGLDIGGGANVEIRGGGNLLINSPISLSGGSTIIIGTGDTLHINGNASLTGNSSIIVNGFLVIDGNLVLNGNANICGSGDGVVNGNITGSGWCFTGVLPIELIRFDGWASEGKINLQWTTGSEVNNDYFTIEHSTDGIEFKPIGSIDGAGHSSRPTSYSFEDPSPSPGTNFYRLRQTNFDGVSTYSFTVRVNAPNMQLQASIFPNLVRTGSPLYVTIGNEFDYFDLNIFDLRGNLKYSTAYAAGADKSIAIHDHKLTSGQYILMITSGEGNKQSFRLLVQ